MDESDKIKFKEEYGADAYIILNKYDLWDVDPYILYDLSYAITMFCRETSKKNFGKILRLHRNTRIRKLGQRKINRFRKNYYLFNVF